MSGFDETFDWVVVGSGGGSMSSGAADAPGRQVGRDPREDRVVGGTTAKSGGVMWIPNNRFMEPGEDSTEQGITYLDAVCRRRPGHARHQPREAPRLYHRGAAR